MIWLCGKMSQNQAFGLVLELSVSCLLVSQRESALGLFQLSITYLDFFPLLVRFCWDLIELHMIL